MFLKFYNYFNILMQYSDVAYFLHFNVINHLKCGCFAWPLLHDLMATSFNKAGYDEDCKGGNLCCRTRRP